MRCPLSEAYIQNALHGSGLSQLQNEALDDIATTFNTEVTYGISEKELESIRYRIYNSNPDALFVRNVHGGGRFLDYPQRVFLISDSEWHINPKLTGSPSNRGIYLYDQAAILIHENGDNRNSWCRESLIHEILHSASIFSKIHQWFPNKAIWHQQIALREGITECLTGYVLFKCHPDCYQGWITNQLFRCSVSYRGSVRLWCSLCQGIGIKELAKFYLSPADDLAILWNNFVESIQNKSFQEFRYELNERKPFNETRFRDICVKSIPAFGSRYDSLTRSFDFSQIP